jgi:hypothetical protein
MSKPEKQQLIIITDLDWPLLEAQPFFSNNDSSDSSDKEEYDDVTKHGVAQGAVFP